jgi:Matrixin
MSQKVDARTVRRRVCLNFNSFSLATGYTERTIEGVLALFLGSASSIGSFRRVAIVALALVAALGAPRTSFAFCRTSTCRDTESKKCPRDENECVTSGNPIFWKSNVVRFRISDGQQQWIPEAEALGAIKRGFGAWNQVQCPESDGGGTSSLVVIPEDDRPSVQELEYTKDPCTDRNIVFFRTDKWPYKGIEGTIATTTVNFDPETGEIRDADIAINAAFNRLSTTMTGTVNYDLESIVVHEAGHFFGLAHSRDDAIMGASYSKGDINRRLKDDDKAAICKVYPPGRPMVPELNSQCQSAGCCSAAGPKVSMSSHLPLSLLGIAAAIFAQRLQRRMQKQRSQKPGDPKHPAQDSL